MAASSDYITLPGGLTVPATPYNLAFELEKRQFTLSRDGDVLVIQPHQRLTSEDCQRIRRWKRHLIALVDYVRTAVIQ